MATSTDVQIQVSTDGRVPPGTAGYARAKVRAVLRLTHRRVLAARVRVTRHGDPVVEHPVVAQANLDLSGRLVRAQAEGETAQEAIDRLEDRLRHRVERIAQHWEARRGGMPSTEPHEWRHESEQAHRHRWYPRPPQEREIVRRKSFTLHRCTVDEAASEMEMLGYDFHLFSESGTGRDAVIYRGGETGYRLAMMTPPGPHQLAIFRLPVTISAQTAPALTVADAVTRLNLLDLPFLFFRDADSSRCAVLYHRYDGHYGLITAADEPDNRRPGQVAQS